MYKTWISFEKGQSHTCDSRMHETARICHDWYKKKYVQYYLGPVNKKCLNKELSIWDKVLGLRPIKNVRFFIIQILKGIKLSFWFFEWE